jgi:hypothetical protein
MAEMTKLGFLIDQKEIPIDTQVDAAPLEEMHERDYT